MTELTNPQLLGEILQTAGLVSAPQIQVALIDREYNRDLRLGEILAFRGWVEQQTVDFFADEWQFVVKQADKYPLGYYLEKSGLLSEAQINSILQEQKQLWVKFGTVAIIKGLLEKPTVDFFLKNLYPEALSESPFIDKKYIDVETKTIDKPTLVPIDPEDIPWID